LIYLFFVKPNQKDLADLIKSFKLRVKHQKPVLIIAIVVERFL